MSESKRASWVEQLGLWVLPTLFVLMSIPFVTLGRGCVSDASPYVLIAGHEAPESLGGGFLLGSSGGDQLLLTEPRIEEGHGQLLEAGEGAWVYLHRTDRAAADFQNPGRLGRWRTPAGSPRYSLPLGVDTVVLSGLSADQEPDDALCDPALQDQHVRHVLRPLDAGRVAVRVDGEEVGAVDVPLAVDRSVSLGRSALTVCGEERDLYYGGCADGLLLPAPASQLSVRPEWVAAPDLTGGDFGRRGGSVELARVDGTVLTGRSAGLDEGHVLVDDGTQVRVLAVHDRRQPVPLEDPLGGEPSLAVTRKRAGGQVELLVTPRPGTRVVRCSVPGRRLIDPRTWGRKEPVAVEMGRARIERGGLLIVGTSRFSITPGIQRSWGEEGRLVSMTRLEPVERPENFHVLTSLSAGRLLQRRGSFTLPDCGDDEASWAVVRARTPRSSGAEPGTSAADAEPMEEPGRVRVDERVERGDDRALRQTAIDLPAPAWATDGGAEGEDGVPVLHLCHDGSTVKSRPLIEPGVRGALGAVLDDPGRDYPVGSWTEHRWGDRVAVAGQVLELRGGLARYERTVPLLLLWIILGLAGGRMLGQIRQLRSQLGEGRGARAASAMLVSIPPIVFLLLAGCLLMGRMAAHPHLLGNPDYLHRSWFSAVVAAFALPACLAFFVRSGAHLMHQPGLREWVDGLAFSGREFGLALLAAAAGGVLDGLLWWTTDGLAPLEPIRAQIKVTIVLLVVGGVVLWLAPRWVPPTWDRLAELTRRLLERVGRWWRGLSLPWRSSEAVAEDPWGSLGDWDDVLNPADPEEGVDRSGWPAIREVVLDHPWLQTVFGKGGRDLGVVLLAPVVLGVGSLVAVAGGGAAHNNIEFGFGLGLKPADLLIIIVGLAVVASLTRHWDRPKHEDEAPAPAEGAALDRLKRWVTGGSWLPAGRGPLGWTLRGLTGAAGVAVALLAWAGGLITLAPALVAATLALAVALAPPTWVLTGLALLVIRYGVHAAVLGGTGALWALGLVGPGVAGSALAGIVVVEGLIRVQPQLASLLAVLGLLVVVTVVAFAAQGDFGPLMVTVPAILVTGAYWAMARPREDRTSTLKRMGVVGALLLLVVPGVLAGVGLASTLADQVPDFQRAADRLLIWREPWYALGADWSVRGRWIASGAFGDDQAVWVANLHSDLAWVALMRSYGLIVALSVLVAYFVVCTSLVWAAEETLAHAGVMQAEDEDDPRRHWVRGAALFAAFASFYLAAEVFVHVATCFTRIPPTGLTLPWISNGGSAALGYALLVGVAIGAVLVAHRVAAQDAGGVR